MKFKLIALLITIISGAKTLHIHSSACNLPTVEDIQALKKSRDFNTNWPKELHNHFKTYSFKHDDYAKQHSLLSNGQIVSGLGALWMLKETFLNQQFANSFLLMTSIYSCAAYYMHQELKKNKSEQELLIHKCTRAFDLEDLTCLKTWLTEKTDPELSKQLNEEQIDSSLTLLDKVLNRKQWIIRNQKTD